MSKFILISVFTLWYFVVLAQGSKNITLLSHIPLGEESSDIWGYTDEEGLEYAIIGVSSGVKIFSLEDPESPELVSHILSDKSIWRDIKSYNNKLYAVADEGNDGLLVIDMENGPDTITWNFLNININFENINGRINTCHNLFIDSLGYLYLAGCNIGNRGVIISKINNDSSAITPLGITNSFYTHDVFVNGNKMYSSDILAGQLSIYDISDKSNPVLNSSIQTGKSFTHNAWTSDDNKIVFTTDEVAGAFVEAYNIEDLDNIQFLDRIQSNRANSDNVIIHNVHFYNNYLVSSHYTEGVTIVDAEDPSNLVEVGYFDPFTNEESISGNWFDGCWGAYPFFPSGIVAISDITNGLYILKPEYIKASRLQGLVLDKNTSLPVRNASVNIISREDLKEFTDLNGRFKTGSSQSGNETLVIDHPLYNSKEISVELVSGSNVDLTVELTSMLLNANIIDLDNDKQFDVKVKIIDNGTQNSININNIDGTLITPLSNTKTYTLIFAKWGMKEKIIENFNINSDTTIDVLLQEGYEDSFTFDQNWQKETLASDGSWQRGTPIRKTFGGKILQPNFDSPMDIGNDCYFTNLNGGGSNSGDVDNGFVVLKSPNFFLGANTNYEFSFDYWFCNTRGNITGNDSLTVYLKSTIRDIKLTTITESGQSWRNFTEVINMEMSDPSIAYYLEIIAFDKTPTDHVVEAGFDYLRINKEFSVANENLESAKIILYPNPVSEHFYLEATNLGEYRLFMFDSNGKLIYQNDHLSSFNRLSMESFIGGIYYLKLEHKAAKNTLIKKLIKL